MTVLRRCEGKHPDYVFTYRGEPFQGVDNQTWKRACRRAGITNFRWHDLRHTWASWHVQAGTSLHTLMELGGWACYEMVLSYADLASDQLQAAAANIDHTQNNNGSSNEAKVTNQLRCTVIPFPQERASRRN